MLPIEFITVTRLPPCAQCLGGEDAFDFAFTYPSCSVTETPL